MGGVPQLAQVKPSEDPQILDESLHQLRQSMRTSPIELGLGEPAVWGAAVDVLAQLAAMRPAEYTKDEWSVSLKGVAASIMERIVSNAPEKRMPRDHRVARIAEIMVRLVPAERGPSWDQPTETTAGGKQPQLYLDVFAQYKTESGSQSGANGDPYAETTAFVPDHPTMGTPWSGASSSGGAGSSDANQHDKPGKSATATYTSHKKITSFKSCDNAKWARDRFERILLEALIDRLERPVEDNPPVFVYLADSYLMSCDHACICSFGFRS